jgi:hypothetical protein
MVNIFCISCGNQLEPLLLLKFLDTQQDKYDWGLLKLNECSECFYIKYWKQLM